MKTELTKTQQRALLKLTGEYQHERVLGERWQTLWALKNRMLVSERFGCGVSEWRLLPDGVAAKNALSE